MVSHGALTPTSSLPLEQGATNLGTRAVMDSRFHSTVMQRPQEDDGRERMNGTGGNPRQPRNIHSPSHTEFQQPFSPTKAVHPRPTFNNPYHPPTPAPLPLPGVVHVDKPPVSPLNASYPTEYQHAPRDKPASNYYDPTSDSSERRPSEAPAWYSGNAQTSQVRLKLFYLHNR